MGYYDPLDANTNGFTAWKLRSAEVNRYLYRYTDGYWRIASVLGSSRCMLHSKTESRSPFTAGLKWRYWDADADAWRDDESVQVSKSGESDRKIPYEA